ncbi:MAG: hypothetical protein A2Z96_04935 [Spirochaetes bacterium GWB1_48_6]|nr:MAG: hypothetical protein A2Z96_04935 [Spirochaetes bacterium GWB1_48_6]
MNSQKVPELQVLRDKAYRILDEAEKTGHLNLETLSYKKAMVEMSSSFEEIDRQLSDLMEISGKHPNLTSIPKNTGLQPLSPRATTIFCLMAERTLRAPALGDQNSTLTVMGSTVIDLSNAYIDRPILMDCVTVMGELKVLLPRGTLVENKIIPIMGSVTESKDLQTGYEGPRVILQGIVVMGEVKIIYT